MEKKDNNKNPGFTLIEIAVAIMILGTVFIGMITAFPYALNMITESKNLTRASYLAQAKIEELYRLNYDAIATGTIEVKGPIGQPDDYSYTYERETVVSLIDEYFAGTSTDNGLKKVATTVYYMNAFSKAEKSYTQITVISRRQ